MPEIIAKRVFSSLYIYLDLVFLVALCLLLIMNKKYMTLLFGLAGGVLYFIVDYGIFHLALHTRSIEGGNIFWVLLWMSLSYGLTNFVWIWLWLSKDKHLFEWSVLIFSWWICCPLMAQSFGAKLPTITIARTTKAYHGFMAAMLFVGYAILIVMNMRQKDPSKKINILWLIIIGVLVQFGWEFSLLVGGIRGAGFAMSDRIMTLVVNSLVETNLGLPYIYFIHKALSSKFGENLKKLPVLAADICKEGAPEADNVV